MAGGYSGFTGNRKSIERASSARLRQIPEKTLAKLSILPPSTREVDDDLTVGTILPDPAGERLTATGLTYAILRITNDEIQNSSFVIRET